MLAQRVDKWISSYVQIEFANWFSRRLRRGRRRSRFCWARGCSRCFRRGRGCRACRWLGRFGLLLTRR